MFLMLPGKKNDLAERAAVGQAAEDGCGMTAA